MSNKRYEIGGIVNYCTNEYPFLSTCLKELQTFCKRIVVPVCDCFFDGTPENRDLLEKSERENSAIAAFLHWKLDPAEDTGNAGGFFPEGKARWLAAQAFEDCEFVLFMDVDEVVDSARFIEWLEGFKAVVAFPGKGPRELVYRDIDAFRFRAYWYFRDTLHQARAYEHAGVMVRRSLLTRENVISPAARNSLFAMTEGIRGDHIVGLDGKPMVHHYSWVRTKEQMLKKVRAWGHAADRNWEDLVENEFSKPSLTGVDFVHGYRYNRVAPYATINL